MPQNLADEEQREESCLIIVAKDLWMLAAVPSQRRESGAGMNAET
jgi:hypothetical protein